MGRTAMSNSRRSPKNEYIMRDERRKEGRSKQGQTNNKAKQHSTPKAVIFLRKISCPYM